MFWISCSISHKLHWTWRTPVCADTACAVLIHMQGQLIVTAHSSTVTYSIRLKLGRLNMSVKTYKTAQFWINYHMWREVSRYDLPTAAPCCNNRPDTPDLWAQWPGNWVDQPARSLQTPLGGTGRWTRGTEKIQTQEIWSINIHTVYSTFNKQQKSSEVLFLSGWGALCKTAHHWGRVNSMRQRAKI